MTARYDALDIIFTNVEMIIPREKFGVAFSL